MLETFQARVNAGMESTMAGEDTCPCTIFGEVTNNGDLMEFLFQIWNGALVALTERLPEASLGKIEPAGLFGGEAGEIVERLANGMPDAPTPAGSFGEALRHVIILGAAAGHAAAHDELAGVGQSEPSDDDFEAFLRSLGVDLSDVDGEEEE